MRYDIEKIVARMYIPDKFKNRYLSIKELNKDLPSDFSLNSLEEISKIVNGPNT